MSRRRLPDPHDTGGSEAMPLITLSVQHKHTFDEARKRLETVVHEFTSQFGTLVRRVEWSTDRSQVRLDGIGFWIAMHIDAQAVHVSADIPLLGRLLGGSVTTGLKAMLQRTFQHTLPGSHGQA
jgi:Putative polyhydroxyalkanoic acid system protein (PHA_gran_rgn)